MTISRAPGRALRGEIPTEAYTALHQLAIAAAGSVDLAFLGHLAVDRARRLLDADWASIYLAEGEQAPRCLASDQPLADHERSAVHPEGAVRRALRLNEAVLVDDYPTWPHALPGLVEAGCASLAVLPLTAGEDTVGALAISRTGAPRPFNDVELAVGRLLAAQLAPALRGARDAERREIRERQLRALLDVSRAAAGADQKTLAQLAVRHACELVDGYSASLAWADADGQITVLCDNNPVHYEGADLDRWMGVGAEVVRGKAPVIVNDYAAWPEALPWALEAGFRSLCGVPLQVHDEVHGVLVVRSLHGGHFTTEHTELLGLLASLLAGVLEATSLAAQQARQAEQLRLLHRAAVAAAGVLELDTLAGLTVDHAVAVSGCEVAVLLIHSPERRRLEVVADSSQSGIVDHPDDAGIVGRCLASGRVERIDDYRAWESALSGGTYSRVRNVAAIPLRIHQRTIGVLALFNLATEPTRADLHAVELLAAQVGPSLEAARLARETAEQSRVFRALHDLAVRIGGELDPERLDRLVEEGTAEIFGVDGVGIYAWDEERQRLIQIRRSGRKALQPALEAGQGVIGIAFAERRPMAVEDYRTWTGRLEESVGEVASGMAVPLIHEDRAIGVLGIWTTTPRRFTDLEVQTLTLLAAQVANPVAAAITVREREREARQVRALHDVAVAAAGVLEESALAQLAAERAREIFEASSAVVALLDPDSGLLDLWADTDRDRQLMQEARRGRGVTGLAVSTGQPVVASDYASHPARVEAGLKRGLRSMLAVPLKVRDRTIGVLAMRWNQLRELGDVDVHLAGLVAGTIAPSFEAARLHGRLAASERRMRAIFEHSPLAIMQIQLDGRIGESSPALTKMFGFEPGEIQGAERERLLDADQMGDGDRRMDELLRGELESYVTERRFARKDGSAFWGQSSVALVRDEAGRPAYAITMIEDIDDRRRSEQEMQRRAVTFQALHEVAKAAAGILEPKALARVAAEKAAALLGVEQAIVTLREAEGLNVLADLLGQPGDVLAWTAGSAGLAYQTGQPVILNNYVESGVAVRRQVGKGMKAATAVPLRVQEEVVGTLGVLTGGDRRFDAADVELLQLIAALVAPALRAAKLHSDIAAGAERMRMIVEGAIDPMIAFNDEFQVVEWNQAAAELFGIPPEEAVGRDVLDLLAPDEHQEEYRASIRETLDQQAAGLYKPRPRAARIRGRDGRTFTVEVILSRLPGTGDQPAALASIRDLTDRVEAEVARRESEEKSRFLASMSHELRTPLNSIIGFAQLLGSSQLDDRRSRYVTHIESSGRHLLSLINDVLDLSKVSAGQMGVDMEPIELVALLEEAVSTMRPQAVQKPLELILEPAAGTWARADSRRLLQVLLNLLSNAIKFTPAGGLVTVATSRHGRRVAISVTDTGIGINPADQQLIFQEFTQVKGALQREGTGLGLALSRRLIELMGGALEVQSKVGEGSTFTVLLPTARRPATIAPPPGLVFLAGPAGETMPAGLGAGLRTTLAATPREAAAACRRRSIGAVVHAGSVPAAELTWLRQALAADVRTQAVKIISVAEATDEES